MTDKMPIVIRDFEFISATANNDREAIANMPTEQRLPYEVDVSNSEDWVSLSFKPQGYEGAAMEVVLDIYEGKPRVTFYMQEGYDAAAHVKMSPREGVSLSSDYNGPFMEDELQEYSEFLTNTSRAHIAEDAALNNPATDQTNQVVLRKPKL